VKYVVCFSGGHASAVTAIEAVRRHGKDNVVLLNHDISSKVEHADIKRFKREVSGYLDVPITYANAENFEEMTPLATIRKLGQFTCPSNHQVLCTYYLKTKPFHEWLKQNHPASFDDPCKNITILYGFDKGEESRMIRRSGVLGAMGYKTDYPIALWGKTIRNTMEMGIKPPKTYKVFRHANCIGCLKAGMQHWYVTYCLRPDVFSEAKELEQELGYSIINEHYLSDLEERFKDTQAKGVCPNDTENGNAFWARVSKVIPDQQNFLPCDCAVL